MKNSLETILRASRDCRCAACTAGAACTACPHGAAPVQAVISASVPPIGASRLGGAVASVVAAGVSVVAEIAYAWAPLDNLDLAIC